MAISYEEALATLEGMFGEKWSREQLDAVLRNKQGHMENTVDLILSHGDRDPQILIDKLSRGEDPNAERINADEELARSLANGNRTPRAPAAAAAPGGGGAAAASASRKGQRGTPTNLPSDFLRIPTHSTTTSTDQMESDEALARMLQDKMFSEEISRNPDFAHLARGRNNGTVPASSQRIRTSQATASNRGRAPNQPPDIDIMRSLGELGKSARSKLQMMAAQFNAKTGRGASATNGSSNAGVASAAGSSTTGERRGLLDDDENDEDVALEFATRKDL